MTLNILRSWRFENSRSSPTSPKAEVRRTPFRRTSQNAVNTKFGTVRDHPGAGKRKAVTPFLGGG
jgi:hypothetical protein